MNVTLTDDEAEPLEAFTGGTGGGEYELRLRRAVERIVAARLAAAWAEGYAAAKNYDTALRSGERPGRPANPYRDRAPAAVAADPADTGR